VVIEVLHYILSQSYGFTETREQKCLLKCPEFQKPWSVTACYNHLSLCSMVAYAVFLSK